MLARWAKLYKGTKAELALEPATTVCPTGCVVMVVACARADPGKKISKTVASSVANVVRWWNIGKWFK